jgi:hypothetical protein
LVFCKRQQLVPRGAIKALPVEEKACNSSGAADIGEQIGIRQDHFGNLARLDGAVFPSLAGG